MGLIVTQVDPRIGFVVDGKLWVACNGGRQFDFLDFTTREFGIDGHVHKRQRTDPHAPKQRQELLILVRPRRHGQQVAEGNPFEPGRILETVGNARFGPFRDRQRRDIRPFENDFSGRDGVDPHDQFGKGRLAAAVGTGDGVEFPFFEREIHAVDDMAFRSPAIAVAFHRDGEKKDPSIPAWPPRYHNEIGRLMMDIRGNVNHYLAPVGPPSAPFRAPRDLL